MSATNEVMSGKLVRLRHTVRFSAVPVVYKENVAEHGYWTAVIAMAIVADLHTSKGEPAHRQLMGEVAMKALWHDVEESMTGDVVRDLKYATPDIRNAIRAVEEQFAKSIFDPMGPAGVDLHTCWMFSKDDTRSGRIVALADLLCVIAYCDHDFTLGNRNSELFRIKKECTKLIHEKTNGTELEGFVESLLEEWKWS